MRRPTGSQGSWFAKFADIEFPCVHAHWYQPGKYDDPNVRSGTRQWDRYVARIQELGFVILTNDDIPENTTNGTFRRRSYIAIFEVSNALLLDSHLTFDVIKRIEFDHWSGSLPKRP